jgi:hypothetical protein
MTNLVNQDSKVKKRHILLASNNGNSDIIFTIEQNREIDDHHFEGRRLIGEYSNISRAKHDLQIIQAYREIRNA